MTKFLMFLETFRIFYNSTVNRNGRLIETWEYVDKSIIRQHFFTYLVPDIPYIHSTWCIILRLYYGLERKKKFIRFFEN